MRLPKAGADLFLRCHDLVIVMCDSEQGIGPCGLGLGCGKVKVPNRGVKESLFDLLCHVVNRSVCVRQSV